MKGCDIKEYFEEPSKYALCTNADASTKLSWVVVEDDPGPYLELLAETVQSGRFGLAMTAPFSDKTLALLSGDRVAFGDNRVEVQIPDLSRCVVVLDMRNDAKQSFREFDQEEYEIAGYRFFQRMGGFPGRVFIATRYGRDLLDAKGYTGYFGVVLLKMKMGHKGAMPSEDREAVLTALGHALTQASPRDLNVFELGKDFAKIIFHGETFPAKNRVGIRILFELLKEGSKGVPDVELCRRVGYAPKPKRGAASRKASGAVSAIQDGLVDTSAPSVVNADDRKAAQDSLDAEKRVLDAKRENREAAEQAVIVVKEKAGKLIKNMLARIEDGLGDHLELEDSDERTSLSVLRNMLAERQEREQAGEVILSDERELVSQLYDEIDTIDGEMEKAVLALNQASQQFAESRRRYDDLYRICKLSHYDATQKGYVVPKKASDEADFVRQYVPGPDSKDRQRRIVQELLDTKPVSNAFVRHVEQFICRDGGVSKYTGSEKWVVRLAT